MRLSSAYISDFIADSEAYEHFYLVYAVFADAAEMEPSLPGSDTETIYIRYITSCQSTEEVELIPTDEPARKLFIGGHLYIEINNQLYNITGQKIH